MSRIRISTTVDGDALLRARALDLGSDSQMVDAALEALLTRHRSAEIDARYAAYDAAPIAAEDEWGDIEAFRRSVGRGTKGRRRAS